MFALDDHWVWDFWLADDGENFHLFYLHAPKSLGDPHFRHRAARIGHAVSTDLRRWKDRGEVLRPGRAGDFDETATWTGSVVIGDDGIWRMFYTGSVFHSDDSHANTETIGVATSPDLETWTKVPGLISRADPKWYEILGDSEWQEEAWRDPWVFRDPQGHGWHMLVTARSASGPLQQRGVVGHSWSADLETWETQPPISATPSGFGHLEVLQLAKVEGRNVLIFSASTGALHQPTTGSTGGIWVLDGVPSLGPFDVDASELLLDERLYSGRIAFTREGEAVLLAFEYGGEGENFIGRVSDPMPLTRDNEGKLQVSAHEPSPASIVDSSQQKSWS